MNLWKCIPVLLVTGGVGLGAFFLINGNPFSDDSRIVFRPDDAALVATGQAIYVQACASCHGNNLEGQENWRVRNAEGKLPAPPHDETGHTWHHVEQQLFEITKLGVKHFAGADYATDMPAFGDQYSDQDIIAVLSYIKSTWPPEIRERHDAMNAQPTN